MMYSVAQRRSLVGTHILQDKRITLASERPQLTLSFKKEDPRKVEVKTPTKRSKKMFYFASRDEVSPFRLVAPGSRPCGWWRFVTRWDCITFNCFCLVSEPPGSLCAYSWLFVFFVLCVSFLFLNFCLWWWSVFVFCNFHFAFGVSVKMRKSDK